VIFNSDSLLIERRLILLFAFAIVCVRFEIHLRYDSIQPKAEVAEVQLWGSVVTSGSCHKQTLACKLNATADVQSVFN
jgi:hypothetical protein